MHGSSPGKIRSPSQNIPEHVSLFIRCSWKQPSAIAHWLKRFLTTEPKRLQQLLTCIATRTMGEVGHDASFLPLPTET